jgi:hypothetical protein
VIGWRRERRPITVDVANEAVHSGASPQQLSAFPALSALPAFLLPLVSLFVKDMMIEGAFEMGRDFGSRGDL